MISTTNRFLLCPALVVLMLSVGCASISQDTIAAIKSPVRCDVADRDIAFLEDEKAGGFRRSLAGVTAILPPGSFIVIIRGILGMPRGIWVDKWRVASMKRRLQIDTVEVRDGEVYLSGEVEGLDASSGASGVLQTATVLSLEKITIQR